MRFVLHALGHEASTAQELKLAGHDDVSLAASLIDIGYDWVLTLDQHRKPEVWSALYLKIAEGRGRVLRIRIRKTQRPTIEVLTRYLVGAYEEWSPLLQEKVLIDLGRRSNTSWKAYGQQEVGAMTQQELTPNMQPRLRKVTPSRRRNRE